MQAYSTWSQGQAQAMLLHEITGTAEMVDACSFRIMPAKDQGGPALAVLQDDASEVVIQPTLKQEVSLGHREALDQGRQLHWPHLLPKGKDAMGRHF